jgi:hypothetical protein
MAVRQDRVGETRVVAANWWHRWFGGASGRVELPEHPRGLRGPRVTGFPQSSNGASSLHLRWRFAPGEDTFDSVSVQFEVIGPPEVARLYFWALQADFGDDRGRRSGGAHLGLQWHPDHPGSTAVNWGGYDGSGTVLHGSTSQLPSALANPHTRDFPWTAATPYRLTIARAPEEDQPGASQRLGAVTAWRGSVTDLTTGVTTVVRDLYPPGDRITGIVMWSEVFARCDDPPAAVRWSRAQATRPDGAVVRPVGFGVNYQAEHDGGCANSDSSPDPGFDAAATAGSRPDHTGGFGIVQSTGVARRTPQGDVIRQP